MAKNAFAALFLVFLPLLIFGQTIEDFNDVVDFDITLGKLARAAAVEDREALPNRLIIVDGAVASRLVIDANPETYMGQIELVGGEWLGVEEVVTYRCFLLLEGPRFADAIPARRSRIKNPDEIEMNSRIMVVAEYMGLFDMDDGTTVAVLRAHYIRSID